jgi:hypothetical protein
VRESENEPSQIILDMYDDPEIGYHYLRFVVRLQAYDRSLTPRLHRVSEQFYDQMVHAREGVMITTDHRPMD